MTAPNPHAPTPSADAPPPRGLFPRLRRTLRGLGLVGFYALFASTVPLLGSAVLAGIIVAHQRTLEQWVAAHPILAPVLYCLAFIVLTGLAILPTTALSVIGGWALGFGAGFPAALIGYMGAAVLGFQLSRRAAGERVVELLQRKPRWRRIYRALLAAEGWRPLLLIVLLRLPPTFPFAPMNVLFAAVGIRRRTFILGSFLGMAPRTAVVIYLWSGLAHLAKSDLTVSAGHTWLIVSGLVLTVAALVLVSILVHQALNRLTAPPEESAP